MNTLQPKPKKYFNIVKNILFIVVFIAAIELIGLTRSIFAYLLFILLMSIVRLARNKEFFVNSIKSVEAVIFGKALDRDLWKKDELKTRKIKVVWRSPQETKGGGKHKPRK